MTPLRRQYLNHTPTIQDETEDFAAVLARRERFVDQDVMGGMLSGAGP
jgi:hypothetical protein